MNLVGLEEGLAVACPLSYQLWKDGNWEVMALWRKEQGHRVQSHRADVSPRGRVPLVPPEGPKRCGQSPSTWEVWEAGTW